MKSKFEFLTTVLTACLAFMSTTLAVMAQFPPSVRASELDGRDGFVIQGTVYNQFGNAVAGLGDINADGIHDFASGGGGQQWYEDCYCEQTKGMIHVFFGKRDIGRDGFWILEELDGKSGFRIPEDGVDTGFGAVSAAGDFNNDGIDDFVVGAADVHYWTYGYAGANYIIFGRSGLGSEGTFDLATLDGTKGFIIYGGYTLASLVGVKAIGDFNADGIDDIAVASIRADSFAGRCYVIFGGTDIGVTGEFTVRDLTPDTGIIINGIAPKYSTGTSLESAGDVNGDGFPDIIIGTSKWSSLGEQGEAYVVFGGQNVTTNGVLELSELNGENGFVIRAAGRYAGVSGSLVTGFGDINGDGYDDIAMNDRNTLSEYWVDVIFGGPDVGASGEIDAATLDGTNGFLIVDGPWDTTMSVSKPKHVGDLNHDGYADFSVLSRVGHELWIVYGGPEVGRSGYVTVGAGAGRDMFRVITGDPTGIASAGDINADGVADLITGAIYEQHQFTGADLGKVNVLFGRRMGDVDLDADIDLADFQQWTTCMAGPTDDVPMITGCQVFDFNHDGRVDLTDFAGFQGVFDE